ncbi:alginate export family protein [Roseateles sp.]|uniref:alginate export family protein n=1 Tax=Roseateles sp. TaxID=1971397 RepID=UPI003BA520AF
MSESKKPGRALSPRRARCGLVCAGLGVLASSGAWAQAQSSESEASARFLAWRVHFQAGVNAVAEQHLFWNLAEKAAPDSGYEPNKKWLESYIKPGLSVQQPLAGEWILFGKLSSVASYTHGTDAFAGGNTGAVTLEDGYMGLRGQTDQGMGLELSVGPRDLKLGTGMLIANGASSGFERGALKFGPRKAWGMSGIAKLTAGGASGTAFFVDPNELPSSDGKNRLAGVDVRWDSPQGGFLGATWLRALNSESPYVQAAPGGQGAPTILSGARHGTSVLSAYTATGQLTGPLASWQFAADLAYQWNDTVQLRAWAGRLRVKYSWAQLPWAPNLSYSYQSFSGDDPNTSKLERFDPMYYEGNPSAWSTGSKSSMAFVNSNVNAHLLALQLKPTDMDVLTLRYALIRANQLRSPIQFGQATRFETSGDAANLVAGVTSPGLAKDVFLEYSRVLSRHLFLSGGIALSLPGQGIRDVVGGHTPTWSGGYLNLVLDY